MEKITYRKTLDVHKNGSQFMLQGFETADNLSRVIEISLMASGDAIDFPLEGVIASMYVLTPGTDTPSVNNCIIKDNKIVYDVLPITQEGITTMQLKIIGTSFDGAKSVLAAPKFSVEVTKSEMDDEEVENTPSFTALENSMAKINAVYDARLVRIDVDSDCVFRAYYNNGIIYESDAIRQMLLAVTTDMDLTSLVQSGLVSFTADEVAEKVLSDVNDSIDFKMGNAKYSADLLGNYEAPTFVSWDALTSNSPYSAGLTSTTKGIAFVSGDEDNHTVIAYGDDNEKVTCYIHSIIDGEDKGWNSKVNLASEVKGVLPIENGGTGASNKEDAIKTLGIDEYQRPWDVNENVIKININDAYISADSSSTTEFGESLLPIPLINSGNVYLKYKFRANNYARNCEMNLYLNDNLIKSYSHNEIKESDSANRTLLVLLENVKKGDTIKFQLKTKSFGSTSAYFYVENISLYANADTPYKYINLDLSDEGITASDIINALTGGAD